MPHEMNMPHNTGVYVDPIVSITDYVRGLLTGITFETRLATGDWQPYRSTGEKQHSVYFDSMACVSFSFNNAVESQINWMKKTGLLTDAIIAQLLPDPGERGMFMEFFNDKGEADLSDRALAKLSGTTMIGNSLSWVATTGRNYAVPQRKWNYPVTQQNPVFDWDDFYTSIPPDMVKTYSDIFFKVFKIQTEFITPTKDEIAFNLKQAPIQIASGVCPGWGTDTPVKACSRHNDHATVVDAVTTTKEPLIFDHYIPFGKMLANDYFIDAALKILVTIKQPTTNTMIVKNDYLYQLVEAPGGFALGLDGSLRIDSLDKIIATWLVRNNGNTTGKTIAIKKIDWDSVKHFDLKGNPVP